MPSRFVIEFIRGARTAGRVTRMPAAGRVRSFQARLLTAMPVNHHAESS